MNAPTAVKIKKTMKNLNVVQTQDAVFSLELTHEGVRGAQWIKNGVEIQPSPKYEISTQGTVHTLKIKSCSTQDESVYSFRLGKLSANARLNVEGEKRAFKSPSHTHASPASDQTTQQTPNLSSTAIKIIKKPKDVTALLGAASVFEVVLSEDNIPVRWMFKNTELKANDDYRMISEKKSHKLIVQKVDKTKEGEYTAVVGHLQTSACLTVEGQCELCFLSFRPPRRP